ncbi:MAG: PAS domain S-box protein [Verrucomicrobia bacterium]|nr:PAS domain S-box protein [Verrucomicrobiota bacterium]
MKPPASYALQSAFARYRPALRYGFAVVAVAVALVTQMALSEWAGGRLPTFVLFYPAVILTALFGGVGPGVLAVVLTLVTVSVWILPPIGEFKVMVPVDRLSLVLFAFTGTLIVTVAELYRRNRAKAAAYEREAALRESREALRRQAELIDPIRAGLIAQEMQRVVRERGAAVAPEAGPESKALWRVPLVAGALVAAVGLSVLAGWLFGVDALKSVLPGLPTMKTNTALCFLLAGVALVLCSRRREEAGTSSKRDASASSRRRLQAGMAAALVVLLVAGLTLAEYITGANFGMDELLFRDTRDRHTIFPGRMVQATALGFLLSGASLLLLTARSRPARRVQQALAVCVAVIGTVAILGYTYNVQQFYRFAGYSSMALHTAGSLLALAVGLIFARPDGLARVLATPGPAAQVARRMLPVALLAPAGLGWLADRGLELGLYGEGMDIAALALAMMVSLAALVWWTARALGRADTARRETETHLRNQADLMDHASEALIVREMDGVIRSWNRGAEALYGWTAAEAAGQRIFALLRTAAASVQEFQTALEKTGHWEGEQVHITRGGQHVTVESRQTATRTADGRLLVLESNRDVTVRKQAEAALRASEERFRALYEKAPMGIARIDSRTGRFLQLNRKYCDILGRTEAAALQLDFQAVTHPDDLPPDLENMQRLREGRTRSFEMDKRYIRPDGSVVWVSLTVVPEWAEGHAPGTHIAMVADITERKRAEDALRQSAEQLQAANAELRDSRAVAMNLMEEAVAAREQIEQASANLRASESFYRQTLESIPGMVFTTRPDGYCDYQSQQWADYTGVPVAEHLGDGWNKLQHPDDRPRSFAAWQAAVQGKAPYDLEYRVRRHDGVYEWFKVIGQPIRDGSGRIVRWFGVALNIQDIKDAEEAIKASLVEKEVLLKEIHHRVKNNMQVLSSLVSLQADSLHDPALNAVFADVRDRVRSMALVHEKLYQSDTLASLDFSEYAESLLHYLWDAHGSEAAVDLNLALEPVTLTVESAVPCGLILNELAANALKHAFRGRSEGAVTVSVSNGKDGRVSLRVSDNGAGLPAGLNWREAKSLGLRLVQMLTKQLDGTVEARRSDAGGTEFEIVFPRGGRK